MTAWLQIVSRELLMLAVLAALGSGPAALLSNRFDSWARWTTAPILGLALGAGLFTTLEWSFSGTQVQWVVPLSCVLSLSLAIVLTIRSRRTAAHLPDDDQHPARLLTSLAQIALVCIAVAMPATIALGTSHSSGPVAFQVYDADAYVAETDALQVESVRAAEQSVVPPTNLVVRFFDNYAQGVQELDYAPLSAAINPLVGLHSTDTQSEFLIAIIVAGALGMYGAIRRTLRRSSWVSVLGAVLFAGSFFMQLFFDGSEAALAGLALLVPFLVVAYSELSAHSPMGLVAVALLLEGLYALYPTLLVPLGMALLLALCLLLIEHLKKNGMAGFPAALSFSARLAGVVALAVLINVVVIKRDVAYWRSLLHGGFVSDGLPQMHLTATTIPGWVLQTRGLYSFAFTQQSVLSDFVPALLVPIALALCAIPALRRYRVAWLVLIMVPMACAIGGYQAVHNACGYCEDRSLLSVTPVVVYLVAVGIGVLAVNARLLFRWLAVGAAGVLALTAALSAERSYQEFLTGAYFLPNSVRSVLAAYPGGSATVLLEGFGEGSGAPAEEAFVYEMAYEQTRGHVSIAADLDDRAGLAYLGIAPLKPPIFLPEYSYVLTRVPGIASGRSVLARAPGVALERRRYPLDISLDGGAATTLRPGQDPSGQAWVIGRLRFVVAGERGTPSYIRAIFALPSTSTVVPPRKGVAFSKSGTTLRACFATKPAGAARAANLSVPPSRVVAMSASHMRCR